jgi:hypothetical protein
MMLSEGNVDDKLKHIGHSLSDFCRSSVRQHVDEKAANGACIFPMVYFDRSN